jgi:hypothetical protein
MAKSVEDVLREITGNLVLQIAGLTARAEAAEEQLAARSASAKSDPPPPEKIA